MGSCFLYVDLLLAFTSKCILANWPKKSQLDLGESTFYIQKEAESLDSASHREQTFLLLSVLTDGQHVLRIAP